MARQIIGTIVCSKCGHLIDVATEDVEWNHVTDMGPNEENTSVNDFGIIQTVTCPVCHAKQKIAFSAKGKDETDLSDMSVTSLEV